MLGRLADYLDKRQFLAIAGDSGGGKGNGDSSERCIGTFVIRDIATAGMQQRRMMSNHKPSMSIATDELINYWIKDGTMAVSNLSAKPLIGQRGQHPSAPFLHTSTF